VIDSIQHDVNQDAQVPLVEQGTDPAPVRQAVQALGDLLHHHPNGQGNEASLPERHDLIQSLWRQLTSANLTPRSDAERESLAAAVQMIRTVYPGVLDGFADGLSLDPLKLVETETRTGILVRETIEGDTRTQTYEDQEREKTTFVYGNEITYSDWRMTRTWEEKQTRSTQTESQTVLVREGREHTGEWVVAYPGDDTGRTESCPVFWNVQVWELKERTITVDFDGTVTDSGWLALRQWPTYGPKLYKHPWWDGPNDSRPYRPGEGCSVQ
jgi:hypothetical protein